MDKEIFEKVSPIIHEYWKDFRDKMNDESIKNYIVNPSMPIIWFGDIEAYFASQERRVITISINPSSDEFKEKNSENYSFCRFPNIEKIYNTEELNDDDKKILYKTLNNYFEDNPYKRWFNHYDNSEILGALNCSYQRGFPNRAIHIDLQSAIATFPKWNELHKIDKDLQERISNCDLAKSLIDILEPDIILYSAKKNALKEALKIDIDFPKNYEKPKNTILLAEYEYKNKPLIYGFNHSTPFAHVKREKVTEFYKKCNIL